MTSTTPSYLESNAIVAGKYRVEGVIGRGGMGTVVAAEHTLLKQRVALKFLHDVEGPTVIERFFREARAATRIESDHICRVMDLGTLDDGAPYIVMELMSGTDLSARLAEHGPMPFTEAADYVLQALDALVEAHVRGIVHRDLKPSNLFIARRADGTEILKVLDFGISKLEGGGDLRSVTESTGVGAGDTITDGAAAALPPEMTETGSMLGSPPYMSPEQLRSTRDVDARTDVWALGIILYELVAGARPFVAPSRAHLLQAIVAGNYVPLRVRCPDVSPAFEAVVDACLRVDMWSRCPSAIALADALAPFVPNGEARTARAHRLSRSAPPSSRDSALPSAGALAASAAKVSTDGPLALDSAKSKKGWVLPLAGAALLALMIAVAAVVIRVRASEARTAAAASSMAQGSMAAPPPVSASASGSASASASGAEAPSPALSSRASAPASASATPAARSTAAARPVTTSLQKSHSAKRNDNSSAVDLGRY